jgi:hypothetical protein
MKPNGVEPILREISKWLGDRSMLTYILRKAFKRRMRQIHVDAYT